jgi:hypothetical protein
VCVVSVNGDRGSGRSEKGLHGLKAALDAPRDQVAWCLGDGVGLVEQR